MLVQEAGASRERALEQLMIAQGDNLLRLCILYLRDSHLAQDALQESFLKAYRRWDSFQGDSGRQTWMTGIVINTCKDMLRSAWLRRVDRSIDPQTLPDAQTLGEAADDTVIQSVMALPLKYREVILLYYYQNFSIRETAQTLRISEPAVKSRLKRAKDKLRGQLEGWYFDEA